MVFALYVVIYPIIFQNFFNNKSIAFILIFSFGLGVILIPMLFEYLFISSPIVILFIVVSYLRNKKTVFKQGTFEILDFY